MIRLIPTMTKPSYVSKTLISLLASVEKTSKYKKLVKYDSDTEYMMSLLKKGTYSNRHLTQYGYTDELSRAIREVAKKGVKLDSKDRQYINSNTTIDSGHYSSWASGMESVVDGVEDFGFLKLSNLGMRSASESPFGGDMLHLEDSRTERATLELEFRPMVFKDLSIPAVPVNNSVVAISVSSHVPREGMFEFVAYLS
jgi:hypothetical protein